MTTERRSETKLVKPENTLKKKAGNGGFDERVLLKAQDMIETNTIEFVPVANDLVAQLGNLITGLKATTVISRQQMDEIMYPLMQLKSQGSLFHYNPITNMSHTILDFVENVPAFDEDIVKILEAYKKSINAILKLKIKDEKNKIARDLQKELIDVCERYKTAKLK